MGASLILNEKNKIVYANKAALKLLGKEADKVIGLRVTTLKRFSEVSDQLNWLGKPAKLLLENTADRRMAKLKANLKKSLEELEKSKEDLSSTKRSATDAEDRAQEMEDFLEQMEIQQSELEARLEELEEREQKARAQWEETEAELLKKISRLETSLAEKSKTAEEESQLRLGAELALEAARREADLLNEEAEQLRGSSESQDSVMAQKIEKLQNILLEADAKEATNLRRVTELESALKDSRDETTIANYDLNELKEKLQAMNEKREDAESRAKAAAEELCKAWEEAEIAQKKTLEAQESQKKSKKRTAELEKLMEKFTPEADDTIMEFL